MLSVDSQPITTSPPLRVNKTVFRFSRPNLPPVRGFFETELGGPLSRPNRQGWAMANCPFHASKSKKSFSVNVNSGAFHCFGCDASGGDVIDFVRLRDGLTFKEACQQLGAWDDAAQPTPPPVMVPVRYLVLHYDINGLHHRASVEDRPRNYAGLMQGFYREAGAQLTALGTEKAQSDEGETCWARLALGLDELREIGLL